MFKIQLIIVRYQVPFLIRTGSILVNFSCDDRNSKIRGNRLLPNRTNQGNTRWILWEAWHTYLTKKTISCQRRDQMRVTFVPSSAFGWHYQDTPGHLEDQMKKEQVYCLRIICSQRGVIDPRIQWPFLSAEPKQNNSKLCIHRAHARNHISFKEKIWKKVANLMIELSSAINSKCNWQDLLLSPCRTC